LGKDSGAGYYFHVSSKGIGVACGAYAPGPEELRKIRHFIAGNHNLFRTSLKLMGSVQGSTLTRVPKGFNAEHPAADMIKKKQWYWWVELPLALATSPKLKSEIVKRFRATAPMVELLNKPLLKGGGKML
jgi:uncharacterized protein (TIGR02453 family)